MNFTELNQSDRCLYISCPERSGSPALYTLLYVFAAAVVLFTVCGNLLVIISVFHFKQLHTPTNMLIQSLAITDFLIGAVVMLPMFIWAIESCWILASTYCTCTIFVGSFLALLSIYNIVLIAVDRYFALSNPFLYSNIVSVQKMQVIIVSHWCVCMLYNITLSYFNGNFNLVTFCPGECYLVLNNVSIITDFVTSLIIPCPVIIILYTGVAVIARKHVTAIREINNLTRSHTQTNSIRSERKAAKVLGILVAVFVTCLMPYCIYSLLATFTDIKLEGVQIVMSVVCINSSINPVIYALFYRWFKRCVKIIITLQILHNDSSLINVLT